MGPPPRVSTIRGAGPFPPPPLVPPPVPTPRPAPRRPRPPTLLCLVGGGSAPAARHLDHRRAGPFPTPHVVHHAGGLSRSGSPAPAIHEATCGTGRGMKAWPTILIAILAGCTMGPD